MSDKSKQPVINVKNITKSFKIPLDKTDELRTSFLKKALRRDAGYRQFTAIQDINFKVYEGDFFGIVGRNGSGKSTLLKIMSQIYTPDSGSVNIKGTLMPFIELGVGFNTKLSARENVYLNGAMMGFTREEMAKMYDEIVDFAELHDFMEEKLKNFSSGMKVRLAFSIAIRAQSDILLLDEVLAVGDKAFRDKCNQYFKQQKGKKTIVLVTHDMSSVEEFCNRAMLINDSRVVKIGESDEIAALYNDMFSREKQDEIDDRNIQHTVDNPDEYELKLRSISVLQEDNSVSVLDAEKPFKVVVEYESPRDYEDVNCGIKIVNSQELSMLTSSFRQQDAVFKIKKGINRAVFEIQNVFTDDDYHINVSAKDMKRDELLLHQQANAHEFSIEGRKLFKSSLVHPNVDMKLAYGGDNSK